MTTQQKAVQHYTRMIDWAEKQDPDGRVVISQMDNDLGESWGSEDCDYCQEYTTETFTCKNTSYKPCPLGTSENCCGELWMKMNKIGLYGTWKEWIEAAIKVREFIRENG